MKILLTGGAGFLGGHVRHALRARGVPDANVRIPRIEETDLRAWDNAARAVQGMDLVIHLAGTTGDSAFHRDHPAEIIHDNLVMGVQLMEAARQAGVAKFITIGSATEYPENAPLPFREENLWTGYFEPVHAPYTVAKKMLSVQAQAYRAQYGFNAIHLLLTNMYGPGNETKTGFVVTNIIRRILEAKQKGVGSIAVWGTGAPTRDFLYVEDAAEGILRAAESYDKPEPVNLGSGWELSVRELAEMLARIMDWKGEIVWDASKPDGQMRRMLDTTRAEHAFGFRVRTSFEDGLRRTVEWQMAQDSAGTAS